MKELAAVAIFIVLFAGMMSRLFGEIEVPGWEQVGSPHADTTVYCDPWGNRVYEARGVFGNQLTVIKDGCR